MVAELSQDRPDLAAALERLAGIDPNQRQAQYEQIRREVLHLRQDNGVAQDSASSGTLKAELSGDSEGGSPTYAGKGNAEPDAEQKEAPPHIKPLSPQAIVLQAYQQTAKPEPPVSLLTIPSA